MLTAESATLNTGQCQRATPTSMKSTTSPLATRSIRLPSAPPRMSARASWRGPPCTRWRRTSHRMMSAAAIENRYQGNPVPDPRPNATPELRVYVKRRYSPSTGTGRSYGSDVVAQCLVHRSRAMTSPAMPNNTSRERLTALRGLPAPPSPCTRGRVACTASPRAARVRSAGCRSRTRRTRFDRAGAAPR